MTWGRYILPENRVNAFRIPAALCPHLHWVSNSASTAHAQWSHDQTESSVSLKFGELEFCRQGQLRYFIGTLITRRINCEGILWLQNLSLPPKKRHVHKERAKGHGNLTLFKQFPRSATAPRHFHVLFWRRPTHQKSILSQARFGWSCAKYSTLDKRNIQSYNLRYFTASWHTTLKLTKLMSAHGNSSGFNREL